MFHEYPYTNFHELNADWIINVVTTLEEKWHSFNEQITTELESFKTEYEKEWNDFQETMAETWENFKHNIINDLNNWKNGTENTLNKKIADFTSQINHEVESLTTTVTQKVNDIKEIVDAFTENFNITEEVDKAFRKLVNEGYVTNLLTDVKNIWAIIPNVSTGCVTPSGNYNISLSRHDISLNKKITPNAETIITSDLQRAESVFKGEPFNLVIFLSGEDYTQPTGQDSDYLYNLPSSEHCVNTFIVPSSVYTKKDWKTSPAILLDHYKNKNYSFAFVSNALSLFSIPEQYSKKTGKWLATENVCDVLAQAAINAVKYKDIKPEFIYPKEINFILSTTESPFGRLIGMKTGAVSINVRVVYSRKSISFSFKGLDKNGNVETIYQDDNPSEWIVSSFNFPALNDDFIFPSTQWLTNKLSSNLQFNTDCQIAVGVSGDRGLSEEMGESAGGKYLGLYSEVFSTSNVTGISGDIWKQACVTDFYFHSF